MKIPYLSNEWHTRVKIRRLLRKMAKNVMNGSIKYDYENEDWQIIMKRKTNIETRE